MVTNQSGAILEQLDYTPFGREWSSASSVERRRFAGQEWEQDTALHYSGARYFTSHTGRFTSADAPGIDQHPIDSQSWSLYVYARNNPLRFIDPTGQQCQNGYDFEREVFCTETIGRETSARHHDWLGIQRFFFDSSVNFAQQVNSQQRDQTNTAERIVPLDTFDKLMQCTSDQFGLKDVLAIGAIAAGQPIPGSKRFRTEGSSKGTSLAGKGADKIFGGARFSEPVATIVGGPGTGRAFKVAYTRSVARAAARAVPYAGWAVLAWDTASIAACVVE
jgi:RHS repeat-associated protein